MQKLQPPCKLQTCNVTPSFQATLSKYLNTEILSTPPFLKIWSETYPCPPPSAQQKGWGDAHYEVLA